MAGYWENVVWHAVAYRDLDGWSVGRGRGVSVAWIVRRALGVEVVAAPAMVAARAAARRLRAAGLVSSGAAPGDLTGGCSGRWQKVGRIGELVDEGQSGVRPAGLEQLVREVVAGGPEASRLASAAASRGVPVEPGVLPVWYAALAVGQESGLAAVEPVVAAVLAGMVAEGRLGGVWGCVSRSDGEVLLRRQLVGVSVAVGARCGPAVRSSRPSADSQQGRGVPRLSVGPGRR